MSKLFSLCEFNAQIKKTKRLAKPYATKYKEIALKPILLPNKIATIPIPKYPAWAIDEKAKIFFYIICLQSSYVTKRH